MFHIGIDLAWADKIKKKANESGIVMLSPSGIFRTLAPMRSRGNMRTMIEGIEAMGREETAYGLGTAMHRPNLRRVPDGTPNATDGTVSNAIKWRRS